MLLKGIFLAAKTHKKDKEKIFALVSLILRMESQAGKLFFRDLHFRVHFFIGS